jgi:folate-binding protein YgfZ
LNPLGLQKGEIKSGSGGGAVRLGLCDMTIPSPIRAELLKRQADLAPYGPPDAGVELVQAFGVLELEYAALRSNCVLIDQPNRGTVQIVGSDRVDFLNRMLTQELKPLEGGQLVCRESFWLDRKGRITADVRVVGASDRLMVDIDTHSRGVFLETLDAFLFAEDAEMTDVSGGWHRMTLAGPTSVDLLPLVVDEVVAGKKPEELVDGEVCEVRIAGGLVVVDRSERLGVPEFGLLIEAEHALAVFSKLTEIGMPSEQDKIGEEDAGLAADNSPGAAIRLRLAGWHAFNIARIEAGVPMFNLDFGQDTLPGETGVLEGRVSFTKGCYLGQEIVARMHSLGHPKQIVSAVVCDVSAEDEDAPEPMTGSPVVAAGKVVGGVTSCTLSPMLGGKTVCFAVLKWAFHEAGTEVEIQTEAGNIKGVVQESLKFVN